MNEEYKEKENNKVRNIRDMTDIDKISERFENYIEKERFEDAYRLLEKKPEIISYLSISQLGIHYCQVSRQHPLLAKKIKEIAEFEIKDWGSQRFMYDFMREQSEDED